MGRLRIEAGGPLTNHARFYAPADLTPGLTLALPDEEAQHATRVLRLGVGARVRVFDGRGHEARGEIAAITKGHVLVEIHERTPEVAEPSVRVTLVQAVLKGDKMDDVIRDAVMMGVTAIAPVVTERSEVPIAAMARGKRHERWQRIAVASAKQCGRAVVPDIAEPASLWPLSVAPPDALTIICVEPRASAAAVSVAGVPQAPAAARLIVGPEGGWSPDELAHGATSALCLTLGERTLRADAVAMVALSALFSRWGTI